MAERKINETALDAWLDKEWKRQVHNAEYAVAAFDVRDMVRNGAAVLKAEDYAFVKTQIALINKTISGFTEKKVEFPYFILHNFVVQSAESLIDALDQIECAAYSKTSMRIIVGRDFPHPIGADMMLCFAVVNHFWRLFGPHTYDTWFDAYRAYKCRTLKYDLDILKDAIRRHLFRILNTPLPAEDAAFHTPIVPPAEFYTEE